MTTSLKDFDFLYEYTEEEKIVRRKAVLKFMEENNLFGAYYEAVYNQTRLPAERTEKRDIMDKIAMLKEMKQNINNSIDYLKSKLITNN